MSDYANMVNERNRLLVVNAALRAALERIADGAAKPADIAKSALLADEPTNAEADCNKPAAASR